MANFPAPPPTMRKTADRIAAPGDVGKSYNHDRHDPTRAIGRSWPARGSERVACPLRGFSTIGYSTDDLTTAETRLTSATYGLLPHRHSNRLFMLRGLPMHRACTPHSVNLKIARKSDEYRNFSLRRARYRLASIGYIRSLH